MDFYGTEFDYIKAEIISGKPKGNPRLYRGRIFYDVHSHCFYFATKDGFLSLGVGKTGGVGSSGIVGSTGGTGGTGDGLPGGTGGTGAGPVNYSTFRNLPLEQIKNYKFDHKLRTKNIIIKAFTDNGIEITDFKSNYIIEQHENYIILNLNNDDIENIKDNWGTDNISFFIYRLDNYIITNDITYAQDYDHLVRLDLQPSKEHIAKYPSFKFCQKIKLNGALDYNGNELISKIENVTALDTTSFSFSLKSNADPNSGYLFLKCLECYKEPFCIDLNRMLEYHKKYCSDSDCDYVSTPDSSDVQSLNNDPFYTDPKSYLYEKPDIIPIRKCFENVTEVYVTHHFAVTPLIKEPENFAVQVLDFNGNPLPTFPWNGHKPFNRFIYEKQYITKQNFKDTTSDIGQFHYTKHIKEPIYNEESISQQSRNQWGLDWGGKILDSSFISDYDKYTYNHLCRDCNFPDLSDSIGWDYEIIDPNIIRIVFYKWNGTFPVVSRQTGTVIVSYLGDRKTIRLDTGEIFEESEIDLPGGCCPERPQCQVIFNEISDEFANCELGYEHIQEEESDIWIIHHNLNSKTLNVECFDSSNGRISYSAVRYLSDNRLLISFSTSDQIHQSLYTNNNNIITKYKGKANIYIKCKKTIIDNNNNNKLGWDLGCRSCISSNNIFSFRQDISQYKWLIKHNLKCKDVSVITYDENNIRNGPDRINIIDENTLEVEFKKWSQCYQIDVERQLEYSMQSSRWKVSQVYSPYWKWTCFNVDAGKWDWVVEQYYKEDDFDENGELTEEARKQNKYIEADSCDRSVKYIKKYSADEKILLLKWTTEFPSEDQRCDIGVSGAYYYDKTTDIRSDPELYKGDPNWEWVDPVDPMLPTDPPTSIYDEGSVGWERVVNNELVVNKRNHGLSVIIDNSGNMSGLVLQNINSELNRFLYNHMIPGDVIGINYVNTSLSNNPIIRYSELNLKNLLGLGMSIPMTSRSTRWIEAVDKQLEELYKLKSKVEYMTYNFAVMVFIGSKDSSDSTIYSIDKLFQKARDYNIGIIGVPITDCNYDQAEVDLLKSTMDSYRVLLSQYRVISGYDLDQYTDFFNDFGYYIKHCESYVGWKWIGNQFIPGHWRRIISQEGYIPWVETLKPKLDTDPLSRKDKPGWEWIPYNRVTNTSAHWEYVGIRTSPPKGYDSGGQTI